MESLNSGKTTAAIVGTITASSVPLPTATAVPLPIVYSGNGAIQTAYTVPAGKKFHLLGFSTIEGAGRYTVYNTAGTGAYLFGYATATQAVNVACMFPVATYQAGEFVKATTPNGQTMVIFGILEG